MIYSISYGVSSVSLDKRLIIYRLCSLSVLMILVGFYRGVTPGICGSLATGATYFGVIESTKKWIEESHPGLGGHWAHFISGAAGKLSRVPVSFSLIHDVV